MLSSFSSTPLRQVSKNKSTGFTLLEVLIALAIFALLSSAIAGQTSSSLRTQNTLETKRMAGQLLNNTVEQYQLMSSLASAGRKTKLVKYSERYWNVEVQIENTRRADMRLMKVWVYQAKSALQQNAGMGKGNAVATITAYLGAS
ncbi:MAG: type II secretion system minor pseudopilin GspI [Pseudomonadales bacterium]